MSAHNPAFYFTSTQSVSARLGDSHSFICASFAGMRELWWQVRGFSSQFPALDKARIEEKFLSGLPTPGGIDIGRMFLNSDWSRHEQEFAKWFVFEACTLYEAWAEKVCSQVFSSKAAAGHAKNIQFPTAIDGEARDTHYMTAVEAANSGRSELIKVEFFPGLASHPLNRWATADKHLLAYRYFKECRNAIIHSGGLADEPLLRLRAELDVIQNATPSPFRHKFSLPPLVVDHPIVIGLRDSILFATVVRFLICTFDAALCVSKKCEQQMEERLRAAKAKAPWAHTLPRDPEKRLKKVRRLLVAARLPRPVNMKAVEEWMYDRGVIVVPPNYALQRSGEA